MTESTAREHATRTPAPSAGDTPPRNPYLRIILWLWIGALVLGSLMLMRATGVEAESPSAAQALVVAGTWSLVAAGATALAHLVVKAILWRGEEA